MSFTKGGAEILLMDLIKKQSACGHDITVIVLNDHYESTLVNKAKKFADVYLLKRPQKSKSLHFIFSLWRIIWKLSPEILHAHNKIFAYLMPICKSKKVFTLHSHQKIFLSSIRWDAIFSISEAIKKSIPKVHHYKTKTIFNCVDFSGFKIKNFSTNAKICIVCVARLDFAIKGQDILLNSFEKLREKHKNIFLTFVGQGKDIEKLKESIKEKRLIDCVAIQENWNRDEVQKNLCNFDIKVLPSRREGFGIAAIEAAGVGLEVIISDTPGLNELSDFNNFKRFKTGDVASLNEVLDVSISKLSNESYFTENKIEASREIREKFSIDNLYSGYINVYSKLLNYSTEKKI